MKVNAREIDHLSMDSKLCDDFISAHTSNARFILAYPLCDCEWMQKHAHFGIELKLTATQPNRNVVCQFSFSVRFGNILLYFGCAARDPRHEFFVSFCYFVSMSLVWPFFANRRNEMRSSISCDSPNWRNNQLRSGVRAREHYETH